MIIKCPECGHQISDKAPTCPSCGVEVAGKITRCSHCGEIFFKEDSVCPHCHHAAEENIKEVEQRQPVATVIEEPRREAVSEKREEPSRRKVVVPPVARIPDDRDPNEEQEKRKKKKKANKTTLIISIVVALLICGVCFYMYKQAQDQRELEEYKIAMKSEEPLILQQYIDTFRESAPKEHLDSIQARMEAIKANDDDWENALKSNTKDAMKDYLNNHPNSPHRATALNKIDSIDWAQTSSLKTEEAFKAYMTEHPDGNHYAEAEDAIRKLKVNEVMDSERSTVASVLHNFFVSINSRDAATLVSSVADGMTLLDKQNASDADVLEMMNKQYKDGITGITWRLPGSYDIRKREIGNERYEYTTNFTARKDVESGDGPQTKRYRVTAKINPDGKISYLKMSEISDEPKKATEETQTTDKPKSSSTEKPAEKKPAEKKPSTE
ncbi:MAG: zinc-ribbon domain-containing protein [Prevotella sp.]|nr:zinc-ribbon domain-containing protein [Prevotella sp.]